MSNISEFIRKEGYDDIAVVIEDLDDEIEANLVEIGRANAALQTIYMQSDDPIIKKIASIAVPTADERDRPVLKRQGEDE